MKPTVKETQEAKLAKELRAKENRERREAAFRHLAADHVFRDTFCTELKIEAKAALDAAVLEASKAAETRNNQHVVDKIREYQFKENAASRVFDFIAEIEKETAKKEALKTPTP